MSCECPTDDYCPKCHPRWYAKWRDKALVVARDLSEDALVLAQREGWAGHARMHPVTAAEYEARATSGDDAR